MKKVLVLLLSLVMILSLTILTFAEEPADAQAPDLAGEVEAAAEVSEDVPEEEAPKGSFLSLLPPIVAIALALITKEVYSSLFVGILAGGVLYAGFNFSAVMKHVFVDGMVGQLADSWNVGILVFLVILGALVIMMNQAGGSAAFGRWSQQHVKTKVGAQLATIFLGVLIFVDDYFNCLTVGSVMRPITDSHGISRSKLAYLIDATAAPVCIIAPISSWAAAVTGFVDGVNGLDLFVRAIPYNFYAILTIVMMITLSVANFDYGPMAKAEKIIKEEPPAEGSENPRGRMIHLVLPIVLLIICCVIGMIYTGGFFEGAGFVDAFSNSDASVGLMYGSAVAFVLTVIFYIATRVLSFKQCMDALPNGFKSMVPAILILTFAWALNAMTGSLGAAEYVAGLVDKSAGSLLSFLPAIIFLIACGLSFATGTSWGTFGILIPIVVKVFGGNMGNELMIISISACMAGAVCGDHCSPISDTTIMASAGAKCDHISHVSTQLPYVLTVTAVSFVCYLFAGTVRNWYICLPVSVALMIAVLLVIKSISAKKTAA